MENDRDRTRIALNAADLVLPWAAFLAVLTWAWRVRDLFNDVPAYSDTLEVLWGLEWYAQSLLHRHNPLYYPAVFAPLGWQVATLAHGPIFFLALMPLYALGGAAFAYNVTALGAHVLAFGGMFKAARLWLRPFASTLVALAFTFWGYRWFRTSGHLHTLISTALLPFQVWAWEQARRHPAHRSRWYLITGVIWAIGITASLYAIWHGLVLLLAWGLAELVAREIQWKIFARGFLISGITALTLSSPTLWLYWQAMSTSLTRFNSVEALVMWSASLNSFSIPSFMHPWLAGIALLLDRGPFNEAEVANFGLAGFLTALLGLIAVRKDKRLWPLVTCSVVGLVFALGPAVKFNGNVLQSSLFSGLDSALWSLGRHIKPALFAQNQPPGSLADAIPLPDMIVAALVPFWEGARVSSRFAFVAAVGLFPLMGWTVERLKPSWLRAGLALVLVFEILPQPTGSVPAKPSTHPAFEWLQSQDLAGEGVVDLAASNTDRLALLFGGDIVFSTLYHRQATVSGVGSYMPPHFQFLQQWFDDTRHPLLNGEFTWVMRFYHVRYLIVHMQGALEQPLVDEARANTDLRLVQCFDPPAAVSPWPYRMCVLEVMPPTNSRFNVVRRDGWSTDEPWGTWIEGHQATVSWVATANSPQQINITLLPICLPDRKQHVTLIVNAVEVADHSWDNCDAWSAPIILPTGVARIGWNNLTIQADLADQPVDPATGQTIDTRRLSIAVTRLLVGQP